MKKDLPFSTKKLLLLGSGELGKEFVIEAQRLVLLQQESK